MTPIQSREEVASSIASGIASAAGSITSADTVTLDGSSEYPGNSTAAEKIPEEANYAASISGVLNDFVELIHGIFKTMSTGNPVTNVGYNTCLSDVKVWLEIFNLLLN